MSQSASEPSRLMVMTSRIAVATILSPSPRAVSAAGHAGMPPGGANVWQSGHCAPKSTSMVATGDNWVFLRA
jgi:hypothetical protein